MNRMIGARSLRCRVWVILALPTLWALLPSPVWAVTYFVDVNNRSARDSNPGTESQPWKTIGKATGLLKPGDTVLVKAGIYRELVTLSQSGTAAKPITIAVAPGAEGKVILNAAEPVMNWRKCTGPDECSGNPNWSHIYYADVAGSVASHPDNDFAVRQVFQHGERLPRSRYPDTRWSYPTAVADPKSTFSDSTLSKPSDYFNGAVCHIKTAQFRLDQIPIARSSGSTIVLATPPNPWYDISTRFGYYITSIVGEINAEGEWAYDATRKRLYLWPRGEAASDVEFSYRKNCLRTYESAGYTVVHGLTMRYAYELAVWVYQTNNITLENNTIEYAFRYGIELTSTWGPCNDNQILRNTIKYSGSRGINVSEAAARCKIEGNTVYATGTEHFGGDLMNGPSDGIYVVGPFARVCNNRIDRTGGVGLCLHGGALNREVSYNYITNSGLALSDTCAIYMAGRAEGPDRDYIHHNIIEDTLGCLTMEKGSDTGGPVTCETYSGLATGIGLDEESNNRTVEDNTVIRSSMMGIGFHWAPDNLVQRNTLYDNRTGQLGLSGKNEEHKTLLDDVFLDNILFATDAEQRTLYFTMNYNDVHFGQSDRNWFYNPYNSIHIFLSRYLTPYSGEWHDYLTLSGWQAMSGYDRNSKEFSYLRQLPQVTLASPTQSRIVYNASLDVNTVDLGTDLYCDVQGNGIRGKLTLQPFESKILISAVAAVVSHQVTNPVPADGGQVEGVPVLEWTAAAGAAFHDVYLGTEEDAVEAADVVSPLYRGRQTGTSFSLAGLVQPGGRYFWRVDEVEVDGTTVHQGVVWTFIASDDLVIDDFESYTDNEGSRIEETWIDGSINHTGSQVGRRSNPSTAWTGGDHGEWSMFMAYDNARSPFISEAQREFASQQDWTAGAMNTLSLWFQGDVVSFGETAPGTFAMSAAGVDIWGASDEFRYAYKRLDGDGAIVARVDSVRNTSVWAKAGVMIRESLDPGSSHAFMLVTPDGRRAFQNRPFSKSADCLSAHSSTGAISLPFWVKLERQGNRFTGYHSVDGINWIRQSDTENTGPDASPNPQTIRMPPRVYVGLALTSHAPDIVTTATFSGVRITGGVTSPWQVAEIGVDQPGNSPDDLYVAIEDSGGAAAVVVHPDPAAVNATAWTEWRIPLGMLAGVDLSQVRKMCIGVGGRNGPALDGAGRIYIDDIHIYKEALSQAQIAALTQ